MPQKKPNNSDKDSELMKKFHQSPLLFMGTVLVLVLVIVTFVFWGAGDWILPNRGVPSETQLTFGVYNGKPIEYKPGTYFAKLREEYLQYYSNQNLRGGYFDRMATQYAFQNAVIRMAILEAMSKANYAPPQDIIDQKIAALPRYQENGAFSITKFQQDDESTHLDLAKQIHDDYITERYYDDVEGSTDASGNFKPAILISPKEEELIANMAKVQRSFKIAVFPYDSYPDSEVDSFVEKNPVLFKKVYLSQITITSSEADAKNILSSIEKGTTNFEEAAKSQSKDQYADAGGDTGERFSFELENLIPDEKDRQAVVELAAGSLSPVIKTTTGWTIFRAEKAPAAADLKDKADLSKIRAYITSSQRGTVEDYLTGVAKKFSADAKTYGFDYAAAKDSVKTESFGPLPLNYGDSPNFETLNSFKVSALSGASENKDFWQVAFSTPLKECSDPIVLNDLVVIYPESEIEDDAAAAESAQKYFDTKFTQTELETALQDSILKSEKFQNHFDSRYQTLFGKNSGS